MLTMHCDVDQENSIEHLRQAIQDIKVDRIDHGTNILEDPALVEVIRHRGIGLTSCPMSNSFVTEGMKAAEILTLLDRGVRVTLNSDDPPYFGGYILENYRTFAEATGADRATLIQLARNSFEIAWITETRRQQFLEKLPG